MRCLSRWLAEDPGFAGYGLNQPLAALQDEDLARDGCVGRLEQRSPWPGTGFTQIQQAVTFFAGSRKVTCSVTPAGTLWR